MYKAKIFCDYSSYLKFNTYCSFLICLGIDTINIQTLPTAWISQNFTSLLSNDGNR